jgi:type III pantothenate kinase
MILDIDAGNTRLKWLLRDGDNRIVQRGVVVYGEWSQEPFAVSAIVKRVRLSSVVGDATEKVRQYCQQRWGVEPEIARVVDGLGGVTCGYKEPSRLGVDRWLALLAARKEIVGRCLVVDAGSALTIDSLLENGIHGGGYIIPGLAMMGAALGQNTWGVRVDNAVEPGLAPGNDTASAVSNGCLTAMVGAIQLVARQEKATKVVITGGDAGILFERLQASAEIVVKPDLIFDGLAIALP